MTKTHKMTKTEIKNVIILQMTKTYKMTRGGRIKLIHRCIAILSPTILDRFWVLMNLWCHGKENTQFLNGLRSDNLKYWKHSLFVVYAPLYYLLLGCMFWSYIS